MLQLYPLDGVTTRFYSGPDGRCPRCQTESEIGVPKTHLEARISLNYSSHQQLLSSLGLSGERNAIVYGLNIQVLPQPPPTAILAFTAVLCFVKPLCQCFAAPESDTAVQPGISTTLTPPLFHVETKLRGEPQQQRQPPSRPLIHTRICTQSQTRRVLHIWWVARPWRRMLDFTQYFLQLVLHFGHTGYGIHSLLDIVVFPSELHSNNGLNNL